MFDAWHLPALKLQNILLIHRYFSHGVHCDPVIQLHRNQIQPEESQVFPGTANRLQSRVRALQQSDLPCPQNHNLQPSQKPALCQNTRTQHSPTPTGRATRRRRRKWTTLGSLCLRAQPRSKQSLFKSSFGQLVLPDRRNARDRQNLTYHSLDTLLLQTKYQNTSDDIHQPSPR